MSAIVLDVNSIESTIIPNIETIKSELKKISEEVSALYGKLPDNFKNKTAVSNIKASIGQGYSESVVLKNSVSKKMKEAATIEKKYSVNGKTYSSLIARYIDSGKENKIKSQLDAIKNSNKTSNENAYDAQNLKKYYLEYLYLQNCNINFNTMDELTAAINEKDSKLQILINKKSECELIINTIQKLKQGASLSQQEVESLKKHGNSEIITQFLSLLDISTRKQFYLFGSDINYYTWSSNVNQNFFLEKLQIEYNNLTKEDSELSKLRQEVAEYREIKNIITSEVDYYLNYIDKYQSKIDYSIKSQFNKDSLKIIDSAISHYYDQREFMDSYEYYSETDKQSYIVSKIQIDDINDMVNMISCIINNEGVVDGKFIKYEGILLDLSFASLTSNNLIQNFIDYAPIMSEDEKKSFNYVYNTEGVDSAYEYLNGILKNLDNRWSAKKTKEDAEYAKEHPVMASLASVVTPLGEGTSAFFNSIRSLILDKDILSSEVYNTSDAYRKSVSELILEAAAKESSGEFLSFLYGTGMSMLDSLSLIGANILTGGSCSLALSAGIMGSKAYLSTLNEALERGVSDEKAVLLALSSAVAETAMENYSMSHLINLEEKLSESTIKAISKISNKYARGLAYSVASSLSQAITEGEEELATEVVNFVCDQLISGKLSNYQLTIENYIKAGYTESQAISNANKAFIDQLAQSFAGGFLSGLCFGSVQGTSNAIRSEQSINQLNSFIGSNTNIASGVTSNLIANVYSGNNSSVALDLNTNSKTSIEQENLNIANVVGSNQTSKTDTSTGSLYESNKISINDSSSIKLQTNMNNEMLQVQNSELHPTANTPVEETIFNGSIDKNKVNDTIDIPTVVDTILAMDVKVINDYLEELGYINANNYSSKEALKQLMSSMPMDYIAKYVIETMQDSRTLELCASLDYNNKGALLSLLLEATNFNIINEKLNNEIYRSSFLKFLKDYIGYFPSKNGAEWVSLLKIPDFTSTMCKQKILFNSLISQMDAQGSFEILVTKIFKNLSISDLRENIFLNTIKKASSQTKTIFDQKYPGLMEQILCKQILDSEFNIEYKALLESNYDMSIFLNKSRESIVSSLYEYIKDNYDSYGGAYKLISYLKIDGLRELLLQDEKIIKTLEDYYSPEKIMPYFLSDANFRDRVDKDSKLYYEYTLEVLSGKISLDLTRISDIINSYKNSDNTVDISDGVLSQLQDYAKGVNISSILSKITSENLSQAELHGLIDYMSILELINPSYVSSESEFLSLDLPLEEYNKIYNYINKVMLENPETVDMAHYQAHIYNFAKYYSLLNGLNIRFKFFYEDSTRGGFSRESDKSIHFNTKYFTQKFKSENVFMDKLEIIFHEVFHQMQDQELDLAEKLVRNKADFFGQVDKYSLIATIDQLLRRLDEDYYGDNYTNILIEIDARYNSLSLLSSYLREVSPSTYEQYLTYIEDTKAKDKSLYYTNFNLFKYGNNNLLLNRDMALDKILVSDPEGYLNEYPLLNFIYNANGTRKTIIELNEIKNSITDQNAIDMINYYIKHSSYSLGSAINEYFALMLNTSDEIIPYIQDLELKIIDTYLLESNYFTDASFTDKLIQEFDRLRKLYPNNQSEISKLEKALIDNYKKVNINFQNNQLLTLQKNKAILIDYVSKNLENPIVIRNIINQCDYDTYKVILNSGIVPQEKFFYLYEKTDYFNMLINHNIDTNFDLLFDLVLSKVDVDKLTDCITLDSVLSWSEESRAKFEQKFPGVIKNIQG